MSDQGTQGLLSPFLRRQRINAARPWLAGSVLDFGCGSGALAEFVPAADYTGFDIDPQSLANAGALFPAHHFLHELPQTDKFDTVVSLAVIEHCKDTNGFLRQLLGFTRAGGRIVLTTPHPAFEFAHDFGSRIGVFSHAASEEHEAMLDRKALYALAANQRLEVVNYRRFLFGANQLIVMQQS